MSYLGVRVCPAPHPVAVQPSIRGIHPGRELTGSGVEAVGRRLARQHLVDLDPL